MKGDRGKWVPENLGISKQSVSGPWGLLPISASSQGTRFRSSLSLDPSGVSVTWDDCSEEAWLFYYSKTTGGPHCRLTGMDSCHLTKENPAPSSLSSPAPASSVLDRLHWTAISWRLCGATYPQLDLTRLSWSFSVPWVEFH